MSHGVNIGYPQCKTDKSDVNLRSLYRIIKNNKQRECDLIT